MKTILALCTAVAAGTLCSCTTHEYPPTQETVVYTKPKPKPKPVVKKVYRVDSPETTTVVRPEE